MPFTNSIVFLLTFTLCSNLKTFPRLAGILVVTTKNIALVDQLSRTSILTQWMFNLDVCLLFEYE